MIYSGSKYGARIKITFSIINKPSFIERAIIKEGIPGRKNTNNYLTRCMMVQKIGLK